jgi:uncharacterized protein (DUF1800 family)|nr:MAG: DUF1800 domain-containing protein [Pseudomonadota bacterium]
MRDVDAAIAANRFGLGARPGELRALGSTARDALRAWLAEPPPRLEAPLKPSHEVLAAALARREAAAAAAADPREAEVANAVATLRDIYAPVYQAETLARFRHAVATGRGFIERLVHFWSNHFAVSVDKLAVLGLAGALEREAIRPHVLGHFADMLLAVEKHPAMLLYLDNARSAGPDSRLARAAGRRGRAPGLNENLGREILELHTLGVDGGYTQQDVRAMAMLVTGWSIGGGEGALQGGEPGRFHFREALHQPGSKVLLGRRHAEAGVEEGEQALRMLALHPATARHLATKLVRHFLADDPPPALVSRVARAYLESEGHLGQACAALVDAPETWSTPLAKYKTPADYIHSAYRALGLAVGEHDPRLFAELGQRIFQPGSPAGWPDTAAGWDGAAALMKRLEWAQEAAARLGSTRDARELARQALGPTWSARSDEAVMRAQDAAQALALFLGSPEFMRR